MFPVAESYRQSMGTYLNQSQAISWIWYDTQLYTSAATTQLKFFGQASSDLVRSNMVLAGAFPNPEAFHLYAIRIVPKVSPKLLASSFQAATDVWNLVANSHCKLVVAHKDFGIWPSLALPGGAGVAGYGAGGGGEAANEFVDYATHGAPSPYAVYTFVHPLQIDPQINFSFEMNWTAAQTLSGDTDVLVMFDGRLIRPVQ